MLTAWPSPCNVGFKPGGACFLVRGGRQHRGGRRHTGNVGGREYIEDVDTQGDVDCMCGEGGRCGARNDACRARRGGDISGTREGRAKEGRAKEGRAGDVKETLQRSLCWQMVEGPGT